MNEACKNLGKKRNAFGVSCNYIFRMNYKFVYFLWKAFLNILLANKKVFPGTGTTATKLHFT